jgi:hypothetical protein
MNMIIQDLPHPNPFRQLNEPLLRSTIFNLLQTLVFLHQEAEVPHTITFNYNFKLLTRENRRQPVKHRVSGSR